MKPKSFVNEMLKDFDPEIYFAEHDMLNALREYKRIKKHNKDEMYLIDLIEKNKRKLSYNRHFVFLFRNNYGFSHFKNIDYFLIA